MKNDSRKTITENTSDINHGRQSVWERFMTLYTCLLPLVVIGILIYHLLDLQYLKMYSWGGISLLQDYDWVPFLLYILSVYVSFFLIPIILLSIKTYDFFNWKNYNHCIKSETAYWKTSIYCICQRFRYSFIGEMIYIFLYFVIFGALLWGASSALYAFCDLFTKTNNSIHYSDGQGEGWSGLACAMICDILNIILVLIILIIFFYVLIRRICEYKKKKAKRKKLNAITRKELQVSQFQPDLQESFDEENQEKE